MKSKPNEIKPIKHSNLYIFLGILAGVLLIAGVIAYKYVADYHIPLQQLERVSQDLRPIYDKLLVENKGNVVSSYYRNECSESSVKYGRGKVSCGFEGRVVLKDQDSELQKTSRIIRNFIEDNLHDYALDNDNTNDIDSMYYKINTGSAIKCYLGYGKNDYSNHYEYGVFCRQSVKNFLPGYQIVD